MHKKYNAPLDLHPNTPTTQRGRPIVEMALVSLSVLLGYPFNGMSMEQEKSPQPKVQTAVKKKEDPTGYETKLDKTSEETNEENKNLSKTEKNRKKKQNKKISKKKHKIEAEKKRIEDEKNELRREQERIEDEKTIYEIEEDIVTIYADIYDIKAEHERISEMAEDCYTYIQDVTYDRPNKLDVLKELKRATKAIQKKHAVRLAASETEEECINLISNITATINKKAHKMHEHLDEQWDCLQDMKDDLELRLDLLQKLLSGLNTSNKDDLDTVTELENKLAPKSTTETGEQKAETKEEAEQIRELWEKNPEVMNAKLQQIQTLKKNLKDYGKARKEELYDASNEDIIPTQHKKITNTEEEKKGL